MAINKTTAQRIAIAIIGLVMTVGTLGAYFLIILQNNEAANQSAQTSQTQQTSDYPVDPTAYKVDGPVTELQKTDLKEGDGAEVKTGDKVTVHYKGTFAQTGQKFQSSYDRGEPVDVTIQPGIGGVIQGWADGVPGMKVGGKRRLVIPAAQAYGAEGQQGIPPNTDLVFEIEVIAIK